MAIKNDVTIEDLIQTFIENSIFLQEYESAERIINNCEHNYNRAKKSAGQISRSVKLLFLSENGLTEFIKLLEHGNIVVAAAAAEYLYPLYPTKCLKIMKKFHNSLKNSVDRYTVMSKLEGISRKEPFFMDCYKKLYNCEDLDSLNREKRKRKSK